MLVLIPCFLLPRSSILLLKSLSSGVEISSSGTEVLSSDAEMLIYGTKIVRPAAEILSDSG